MTGQAHPNAPTKSSPAAAIAPGRNRLAWLPFRSVNQNRPRLAWLSRRKPKRPCMFCDCKTRVDRAGNPICPQCTKNIVSQVRKHGGLG
jgi:hypothetical protein